jgi:glycosyltransferase involved in cell wall biosynthesis
MGVRGRCGIERRGVIARAYASRGKPVANVLHISESDAGGGAGKSARSLHDGLRSRGAVSRMLVGRKFSDDGDIRSIKRNNAWRAADRAAGTLMDAAGLQYVFYPSSFGVVRDPWFRDCDVVQLHNLHGSFFAFPALRALAARRPLVWWMQDMWPVTGHVAYSLDCERWKHGCGDCPYLDNYPVLRRDTTALLWRMKRGVYAGARPTLVVASSWLDGIIDESPLLRDFERHRIPNGVDTDFFAPRDRREALRDLGAESELPTILVFDGDVRKGADLIPRILGRVAEHGGRAHVLVAGERGDWRVPEGFEETTLGFVADERTLATAYQAADVFLFPTLADNLANAVLESLSCGTPLVASNGGGITDAVRNDVNGLLTPVGDVDSYASALAQVVQDADLQARLARGARASAEELFSEDLQARRFLELYDDLLDRKAAA